MNINENTLYRDFVDDEKYLSEESIQEIIKYAKQLFGDYYELTIEDLIEYTNEDTDVYDELTDPEITVLRVYWFKGLSEFLKLYFKLLSNFSVKETPEESMASKECYPVQFSESLLIFAREYFQFHSFKEAAKTTLGDLLIAKKDSYNKAVFERAYTNNITKK